MAKKSSPDDVFYENLTLGLMRTLTNMPRVCNINCEKRVPCEKLQVANWEHRHSVLLPDDMKRFYLSTDGFLLHWSYQYSQNDIRQVGYIHFPHLIQINLLRENIETSFPKQPENGNDPIGIAIATESKPTAPTKDLWGHDEPIITPKTKIFELTNISDIAKVCLVYESVASRNPKIYLLELNTMKWIFLAESFSEYLRMSIGHLGLPFWELCFTKCGLPAWSEQLFLLLAPHLLQEKQPRRSRTINPLPEHPYNVIDPSIFRMKSKSAAKSAATEKPKGKAE